MVASKSKVNQFWLTLMMKKFPVVTVKDMMQDGYSYVLNEPIGKHFRQDFTPELTPKEMLELGVFGGKYMTDCKSEFPASWFKKAKLCSERHDAALNFFRVNASQPLSVWRKKGWIYREDPRGWFQWYCRYYMGRRLPVEDDRQINRWKEIRRHIGQLKKNAKEAICFAAQNSGKRCFTGLMTLEKYRNQKNYTYDRT